MATTIAIPRPSLPPIHNTQQSEPHKSTPKHPSQDPRSQTPDSPQNLLISSPYTSKPHLLDLTRLSLPTQLFAHALTTFASTTSEYATSPYLTSFNFPDVITRLRQLATEAGVHWEKKEFYVVSFRSTLKPDVDVEYLFNLDAFSHQEATKSGGLLKYWYGVKNEQRQNLATCFWESREHAREGGKGPWHKKAREAAAELYESIVFETWRLVIEDDVESWRFEKYEEVARGGSRDRKARS